MKKILRNLMVISLLTILSVAIVYAVYMTLHTHYPSWSVSSAALEVQYPIGTAISTGTSINWGTVYVGTNTRDYRVISRSDSSISVDIIENAPSNYILTHNISAPFTLAHNGDSKDIRFYLMVNSTYDVSTNNGTITFTITGS